MNNPDKPSTSKLNKSKLEDYTPEELRDFHQRFLARLAKLATLVQTYSAEIDELMEQLSGGNQKKVKRALYGATDRREVANEMAKALSKDLFTIEIELGLRGLSLN